MDTFSLSIQKTVLSILPQLVINDVLIERETVTKFLGVLIDENLNWKKHIEYIINKLSKNIGILYRTKVILCFYSKLFKLCVHRMGQHKQNEIRTSLPPSNTRYPRYKF